MANFSKEQLLAQAAQHGTPLFVYDASIALQQAQRILALQLPYGQTIRYAMKANPHPRILKTLVDAGIHLDASSSYEVELALGLGIPAERILLTSQQSAHNLTEILQAGVLYNATSLRQLELVGQAAPGASVGVRLNPGIGSGHSKKANVGGPSSSFGIWHEYIDQALAVAKKYNVSIERVHTHIGSGTDPAVWERAVDDTLALVERFSSVEAVNFGGGFKVARMPTEKDTPIELVGEIIAKKLEEFYQKTGRKLHAELEPGTYFVANAGVLLAEIDDVVDTGKDGYRFVKLNTGMNDILRPTLYGSQHLIEVLGDDQGDEHEYVVVGHNCESGDVLTVAPHDAEELLPRKLSGVAIGAHVAVYGAGAYCASMRASGYNSFPPAKEVIL